MECFSLYFFVDSIHQNHVTSIQMKKQGDSFRDLNENHPIHRQVMRQQKEMKMTLGDVYMNDARVILNAVRRFKRARKRNTLATVYPES